MSVKKSTFKKKIILIPGLIIILLGAAVFSYFFFFRAQNPQTSNNKESVFKVERISHNETVEVSGNIEPIQTQDLKFTVSGDVTQVLAAPGDKVKKDAVLIRLDDLAQQYDLNNLDYQIEQERLSGSQRKLALLQLQRKIAAEALNSRLLQANFNGSIAELDIQPGDFVQTGEVVGRLIDTSALWAKTEVDEQDVPRVKTGQSVTFHFDAYPDLEVQGVVSYLPLEGRVTSQGIAVLDAELRINNPPPQILPSFSFIGEIQVTDAEQLLVVNKEAILERNGKKIAFKIEKEGETPLPVPVQTKDLGNGKVQILSGLAEGDLVVSASQMMSQNQNGSNSGFRMFPFGGGGRPPGGGSR